MKTFSSNQGEVPEGCPLKVNERPSAKATACSKDGTLCPRLMLAGYQNVGEHPNAPVYVCLEAGTMLGTDEEAPQC